jgi:regulator of PEP synthase PpsR (kinase-PPPase family)
MDAIAFSVRHDDGMGTRIEEAELVLVGPSRTCKTPISMYVTTNHGLKVANIPVVPEMASVSQLVKHLSDVSPRIIFGTVMKPEVLASIRGPRTQLMSGRGVADDSLDVYQELEAIERELMQCRRLYSAQNWRIIDVTERLVEEISSTLVSELVISMGRAPEDNVGQ